MAQESDTGDGSTSSSSHSDQAQFCSAARPVTAPKLFQVEIIQQEATLSWEPVGGEVTEYVVSYGLTESADQYATQFVTANESGVVQHQIGSLYAEATYYFKVMVKNDCAPSEWSGVLSGRWSKYADGSESEAELDASPDTTPSPSMGEVILASPSPIADTVSNGPAFSLPPIIKRFFESDPFIFIGIGSVVLAGIFWWLYRRI